MDSKKPNKKGTSALVLFLVFCIAMEYGGYTWLLFFLLFFDLI